MPRRLALAFVGLLVVVLLGGCQNVTVNTSKQGPVTFNPSMYKVTIDVVDQYGNPVPNAKVVVGYYDSSGLSAPDPYKCMGLSDEVAYTDASGKVSFSRLPGKYFCVAQLKNTITPDGTQFGLSYLDLGLHVKPAPANITREAISMKVPTAADVLSKFEVTHLKGGLNNISEIDMTWKGLDLWGNLTPPTAAEKNVHFTIREYCPQMTWGYADSSFSDPDPKTPMTFQLTNSCANPTGQLAISELGAGTMDVGGGPVDRATVSIMSLSNQTLKDSVGLPYDALDATRTEDAIPTHGRPSTLYMQLSGGYATLPPASAVTCDVDPGDGTGIVELANCGVDSRSFAPEPSIQHTYAAAGSYLVKVTSLSQYGSLTTKYWLGVN